MRPVGAQRRNITIALTSKHRNDIGVFSNGRRGHPKRYPDAHVITYVILHNFELWVPLLALDQRKPLQSLGRTII